MMMMTTLFSFLLQSPALWEPTRHIKTLEFSLLAWLVLISVLLPLTSLLLHISHTSIGYGQGV